MNTNTNQKNPEQAKFAREEANKPQEQQPVNSPERTAGSAENDPSQQKKL